MSQPKQDSIPEPPETLNQDLRERLKALAKLIKDLSDRVEKASKEIEELRKKLQGGTK